MNAGGQNKRNSNAMSAITNGNGVLVTNPIQSAYARADKMLSLQNFEFNGP